MASTEASRHQAATTPVPTRLCASRLHEACRSSTSQSDDAFRQVDPYKEVIQPSAFSMTLAETPASMIPSSRCSMPDLSRGVSPSQSAATSRRRAFHLRDRNLHHL